ncbi:MAG: glycosyltransferase, partial [Deltaproteobacteria bacterium]|nr:glycosyltransferase [Deltaproteobacteria bacterium]
MIPNGFDTEIFKPDPDARQLLRGELQASSNAVLMGLIARFDPHKDHETFFAAARLIADALPEVRFVLAGKGVAPSNSILAHLTARHSLQEHVCLLGERSDIPTIMAGLDVLISSSSSEALPSVVGEALACEVPCVVTDVGDSKVLASSGGQIVPPRDPKALARAAIEIGRQPAHERRALGASGRAHIVRNFSIST